MKKPFINKLYLLFPLLLIIWILAYVLAQGPAIQDPNLAAAIKAEIGDSEQLDINQLRTVESLSLREANIQDLEGIQYLSSLKSLDLRHNQIENVEALAALPYLESLDLRGNLIRDISPLENLIRLQELDLRDNHIEDISPVAKLTHLQSLNVRGNQIKDMEPVAPLSALQQLNIRENDITDISALAHLTRLQDLNMRYNQITDINALAELTDLRTRLLMVDNPIEDYTAVAGFYTDIEEIDFEQELYGQQQGPPPLAADDIQDLYLYADEEVIQELYERDPTIDDRVEGEIRLSPDGEALPLDGFRFRGHSARHHPKKSFNIRFSEEQELLGNDDRLNLNASYTDPSMIREKLAWDMFHEIGHVAPRSTFFNLYINDRYEGLYRHVDRVDSLLLRRNGLNPDGTLVRDRLRQEPDPIGDNQSSTFGVDLTDVEGSAEAFLEQHWDSKGEPEWGKLADLVQNVYTTPAGDEYYEFISTHFDLENLIDYLAMHNLIGDVDSYGDDYWLYLDHEDETAQWKLIPWDKDLSFGSQSRETTMNDYFIYEFSITAPRWDNMLFEKFMETPQLVELLYDRIEELMDDVFPEEYMAEKIEALHNLVQEHTEGIEPDDNHFVLHPQNHFSSVEDADYHMEVVQQYIPIRYQYLRREIHPLEDGGGPYSASVSIEPDHTGQPVYFTDENGWTIARFVPEHVEQTTQLTIGVRPHEQEKDINHEWLVQVDHGGLEGQLSLYYRNDIARDNWYKNDEAIDSQEGLRMRQLNPESGTIQHMYTNPYLNKVTASVVLEDKHTIVLREKN